MTTPLDAPPEPRPDRRILWGYLGGFVLYSVLVNLARETSAGESWYRPAMSVAVVAVQAAAAWYFVYIIRLRHSPDSARP